MLNGHRAPGAERKPRSRRLRYVLLAATALVLLMAAGLATRLWSSRPAISGRVQVRGLDAPIELLRDAYGVPHIFAQNERDAYFGLGYAHAQDRLFQIELQRRMASGTLSELLGSASKQSDRFFRTFGLREVARSNLAGLDVHSQGLIAAYTRGLNAALREGATSPELIALGFSPQPFEAVDALVSLKLMAWELSGNFLRELENVRLSRRFSPEQLAQLGPAVPGDENRPWPSERAAPWLDSVAEILLGHNPAEPASATGSNAWAVAGDRSVTGKPLLANDPHLGFSAPAVWYLAHLSAPGLNVIGATLPGAPGVWLGRNDHVAWGVTNTGSDTQDLFIERLDPADPRRVLGPAGSTPITRRSERIRVRGGDAIEIQVRATRHGPIVSDADPEVAQRMPEGHLLALAWTALAPDDATARFPLEAARARDASQLKAATRNFHSPQQNLVFADDAGAVGFVAAGRVPLRASSGAAFGRLPVPGWDGASDWQGYIPFDELPARGADERGQLVSANDKVTPPEYPHWITSEWELPFRANRIAALLAERPRHTATDFERMQLDVINPVAKLVLPVLLPLVEHSGTSELDQLAAQLRRWNGEMSRGRSEPLVFEEWLARVEEALYPRPYFELRRADPRVLVEMLTGQTEAARFCGSERQLDCARQVRTAFSETLSTLRTRYGNDPKQWHWGQRNQAVFEHPVFGTLPLIGRLFNVELAREGSRETINVSGSAYDETREAFTTVTGPSLRAIYDLASPEHSRFILSPGQSGNVLSPHYRDLAALWSRGAYVPMTTARAELTRQPHETLSLVP